MDFSQVDNNPGKRMTGLISVILLHILIVYALISGLHHDVLQFIKKPLETKIIEELKPPPDTPPPPPPKMTSPPPPFIPPPEVSVQMTTSTNAISVVSREAPVAAAPVRHVDTGPVRIPAVVDSRACSKPEYPAKSLRNEETGTVTLQFLIGLDGRVVESRVEKSSGYRDLDNAARNALSLCKFKPGTTDGKPEQSWTKMQYVWKLE
jgi:protein TonB